MHGLYRKNTGRQSLIAYKKYPEFIKTSLNSVCTLNDTVSSLDKVIIHDILPFQAKDLINKTNNTSHIHFNNTSMANWKLSFLCNTMQGSFVQQNKYIDYINNNIA